MINDNENLNNLLSTFDENSVANFMSALNATPEADKERLRDAFTPISSTPSPESFGIDVQSDIPHEEAPFWDRYVAAGILENVTGRLAWESVQLFGGIGLIDGVDDTTPVLIRDRSGNLSPELDLNYYFEQNEVQLAQSAAGRKVLDKFVGGAYDGLKTNAQLIAAMAYDMTEADMRADLQSSTWLIDPAAVLGSISDPVSLVGGYAVGKIGAVAVNTMRAKIAGNAARTTIVAANAGKATTLGRAAAGLGQASREAIGINIFTESALQILDEDRGFEHFTSNLASNYVADVILSSIFRSAGFGIKKVKQSPGIEKAGPGNLSNIEQTIKPIEDALDEAVDGNKMANEPIFFDEEPDILSSQFYDTMLPDDAIVELRNQVDAIRLARETDEMFKERGIEPSPEQLAERASQEKFFNEEIARQEARKSGELPAQDISGELKRLDDAVGDKLLEIDELQDRIEDNNNNPNKTADAANAFEIRANERIDALRKEIDDIRKSKQSLLDAQRQTPPAQDRIRRTIEKEEASRKAQSLSSTEKKAQAESQPSQPAPQTQAGQTTPTQPATPQTPAGNHIPPSLRNRYNRNDVNDFTDLYPDMSQDVLRQQMQKATGGKKNVQTGPIEAQTNLMTRGRLAYSESAVIGSATSKMIETNYTTKAKTSGQWKTGAPDERAQISVHLDTKFKQGMIMKAYSEFAKAVDPRETSVGNIFGRILDSAANKLRMTDLMTDSNFNKFVRFSSVMEQVNIKNQTLDSFYDPNFTGSMTRDDFLSVAMDFDYVDIRVGDADVQVPVWALNEAEKFLPNASEVDVHKAAKAFSDAYSELVRTDIYKGGTHFRSGPQQVETSTGKKITKSGGLRVVEDSTQRKSPTQRLWSNFRRRTTSVFLGDNVSLRDIVTVARIAQDLPDGTPDLEIMKLFDSQNSKGITPSKLRKALAEPNSAVGREVTVLARNLWNNRFIGLVPARNAYQIGQAMGDKVRFDAYASVAAHSQINSRIATVENLTDLMLVYEKIEANRLGSAPNEIIFFKDRIKQYDRLMDKIRNSATMADNKAIMSQLDSFVENAIDDIAKYADQTAGAMTRADGSPLSAKEIQSIKNQSNEFRTYMRDWYGIESNAADKGFIRGIAHNLMTATRNIQLGGVSITYSFDYIANAMHHWFGTPVKRSFLDTVMPTLTDITKMRSENPGELPYLFEMMKTDLDSGARAAIRRIDTESLSADMNTAGQFGVRQRGKVQAATQTAAAINNGVVAAGVSKLSGFTDLSKIMKNNLITAATDIMFHPTNGYIIKLDKVITDVEAGMELTDALKKHGIKDYTDYAFIRNYMTDADIKTMARQISGDHMKTVKLRRGYKLDNIQEGKVVYAPDPSDIASDNVLASYDATAQLMDAYIERRLMFNPGRAEDVRFGSNDSSLHRLMTMYWRATFGQMNKLVSARGNSPLVYRFGMLMIAWMMAIGLDYIRNAMNGRGDDWREDMTTIKGSSKIMLEAFAWNGYAGFFGEKLMNTMVTPQLEDNKWFAAQAPMYNLLSPAQSTALGFATRGVPIVVKKFVRGERLTPSERTWLRKNLSLGLLDTLTVNAMALIVDETGVIDDTDAEELFHKFFGEYMTEEEKKQEQTLRRLLKENKP